MTEWAKMMVKKMEELNSLSESWKTQREQFLACTRAPAPYDKYLELKKDGEATESE